MIITRGIKNRHPVCRSRVVIALQEADSDVFLDSSDEGSDVDNDDSSHAKKVRQVFSLSQDNIGSSSDESEDEDDEKYNDVDDEDDESTGSINQFVIEEEIDRFDEPIPPVQPITTTQRYIAASILTTLGSVYRAGGERIHSIVSRNASTSVPTGNNNNEVATRHQIVNSTNTSSDVIREASTTRLTRPLAATATSFNHANNIVGVEASAGTGTSLSERVVESIGSRSSFTNTNVVAAPTITDTNDFNLNTLDVNAISRGILDGTVANVLSECEKEKYKNLTANTNKYTNQKDQYVKNYLEIIVNNCGVQLGKAAASYVTDPSGIKMNAFQKMVASSSRTPAIKNIINATMIAYVKTYRMKKKFKHKKVGDLHEPSSMNTSLKSINTFLKDSGFDLFRDFNGKLIDINIEC